MSARDLLQVVTAALDDAEIPFMLTGSFACGYHGAARATMDIDLVIDPPPGQLRTFVAAFPAEDFYVSLEAALEAEATRSLFNVIDLTTGWKADLILRKMRPFSETEFHRRVPAEVEGIRLPIATVEDVILSKLEWARLGGSTRQIEDVAELVRFRGDDLDQGYLARWVERLAVTDEWLEARRQAAG